MKTTLSEIRSFWAKDITHYTHEQLDQLRAEEGRLFNEIAWSAGINGRNGWVGQGYRSGKLYKIVGRVPNLFAI